MDQIIFNSTLNGILQSFFAVLVLIVVVHAAVVIARAIRAGGLPTTEEPAVPSKLVEPAGPHPDGGGEAGDRRARAAGRRGHRHGRPQEP